MNDFYQLILGIGFLFIIIILLSSYAVWKVKKRKSPIKRAAFEDVMLIVNKKMPKEEVIEKIQSLAGNLINSISALAGITIAAVFIVIALNISGNLEFEGTSRVIVLKEWILYSVLALSGTASICWLTILDQLIHMKSPSTKTETLLRFHLRNYNLWFYGMILILLALYLFLLLANVYVAMVVGSSLAYIMITYWNILNTWDNGFDMSFKSDETE